jgi:Fanconi anemia group J protein
MKDLAEQCHTVVLASGSLSPIPSLCGELGLKGEETSSSFPQQQNGTTKLKPGEESKDNGARLQTHPRPLEASHVIDLQKQLLAVSIGHFPDGSPLTVSYQNYSKPEFIPKLGDAIASVIEAIPTGGVLVFMPSYSFLRKCVKCWNPYSSRGRRFDYSESHGSDTWDRLILSKNKVIVEPTGSQAKFEEAREDYAETIREKGSCILLAVFRGKMSEGCVQGWNSFFVEMHANFLLSRSLHRISFNDANARGVICLGVPFPNSHDRSVKAKKSYNDEQRRLHGRTEILPGAEWYSQQAYRAIGQALGRCIRHAADYGTVILMDSRHCDDGEPVEGVCLAHRQLPKWMRSHVRNLSRRVTGDSYGKSIPGGWNGLRGEMGRFFEQAPAHCDMILQQQQESLRRSREQDRLSFHRFDEKTGKWDETEEAQGAAKCSSGAQVTPTQGTPMVADEPTTSAAPVSTETNTAFVYYVDSPN